MGAFNELFHDLDGLKAMAGEVGLCGLRITNGMVVDDNRWEKIKPIMDECKKAFEVDIWEDLQHLDFDCTSADTRLLQAKISFFAPVEYDDGLMRGVRFLCKYTKAVRWDGAESGLLPVFSIESRMEYKK